MTEHPDHPYLWLTRLLLALGCGHRGAGDPATARTSVWQCPAHHDEGPSLALAHTRDGTRAMLHGYAGCTVEQVLAALPVSVRYLSRPPAINPERFAAKYAHRIVFPPVRAETSPAGQGMRLESEHPYGSPARAWLLRWRHPQTGAKALAWETRNGRGERVPGLLGAALGELGLYQERDAITAAAMGDPVLVVESESSVDALRRAGVRGGHVGRRGLGAEPGRAAAGAGWAPAGAGDGRRGRARSDMRGADRGGPSPGAGADPRARGRGRQGRARADGAGGVRRPADGHHEPMTNADGVRVGHVECVHVRRTDPGGVDLPGEGLEAVTATG